MRMFRSTAVLLAMLAVVPASAEPTAATAPTQYVDVGRDRIAYRSIGNGGPLLVLNRMRGTLDTWDPLFLDRALKPVNDLADEEVLFFEPESAVSGRAAKASHDRIYARPDVVSRIPSKLEDIQAFIAAHASFRDDATGRREKLMATRTPILILCGDHDISNPVENWFALNARMPNAHLIVYPESGHGPQHQYPELAAQQVVTFLRYAVP